ncbi:MAG: hypothetical protein ABI843_04575 [Dokdonella sp.]
MSSKWTIFAALLALSACQSLQHVASPRTANGPARAASPASGPLFEGIFDNHEQVWSVSEKAASGAPPHVVLTIEPTPQADWSIWRVHLDAAASVDAVWAMQRVGAGDAAAFLLPHRAMDASAMANAGAFDPKQWIALNACALRGTITPLALHVAADIAACTTLAPGLGAQTALLPVAIEREGEWLHARLYADQARGPLARADLRQVQVFSGWAAINGAGSKAPANNDWHMNRSTQLGNEGGRVALTWRDGKASGYSLTLERLTYRDGNVPVLKLSVIEDASGQSLAYAWANPEATQIGINLGWVQVGLSRAAPAASTEKNR